VCDIRALSYERHDLKGLTAVFLDQESLHEQYERVTGRSPLGLVGTDSSVTVKSVNGFFDFKTNTLYCSKMDLTVCGHELHHAILGRFHPE